TDLDTLTLTPTPAPDLQIQAFNAPPSADAGNTVQASFTIVNRGLVATPSHWRDAVYLSLVDHFDYTAQLLGTFDNGAALAVSDSYKTDTTPLFVPKIDQGTFFLLVRADD